MDQESHTHTMASLVKQLSEAEENLRLIDDRIAQHVRETDVPLRLLKEEQRLRARIAELEQETQ